MTENRCPKCNLLNLPSAVTCLQCNTPLARSSMSFDEKKTAEFQNKTEILSERQTADYTKSTQNYSQPIYFDPQNQFLPNTKTGSRTYFWYRMLCSVIVVSGIFWAIIGLLAILGSFNQTGKEASDAFTGGLFMLLSGGIPAIICLLGVIFPPRSWSWIFGILVLVLAVFSCVFSPFAIALLIFWMKPETQSYFGRN
jgi:hypothetical protein